jgi:hypothetical protein
MATKIKAYPLQSSAILRINADKDEICINPPYQRSGDIWDLEKRQLLIDSILNEYDIPKIYFHVLPNGKINHEGRDYNYAVIDGRQRLETIWKFINGDFPLSEDFQFFKDESVKAGNLTYKELANKYPKLKVIFDGFSLPIILIETDDTELIEDMFARLNEAVSLNAAEKRNAFGGAMAKMINEISEHLLFKEKVKFSNKRYQYKEVAARIIFIEYSFKLYNKIIDTKKPYLDNMVRIYGSEQSNKMLEDMRELILNYLNKMIIHFSDKDSLLQSQSAIPIYYLVFKIASQGNQENLLNRQKFLEFQQKLKENRILAENDITQAKFEFLEYDRLSQQGTNDASSIKERVKILSEFLGLTLVNSLIL